MKRIVSCCVYCLACLAWAAACAAEEPRPWRALFDGQSLAGWEVRDADRKWWSVGEGAIVGGSLADKVPYNTFIASQESFQNFELKLKILIQGTEGFINSGVQIRSIRVPDSSEMQGYQVDAGEGWWGKLYDESRRGVVLAEAAQPADVAAAVRPQDWNEYRILAEGRRIRSWINGTAALDYTEPDLRIPLDGHIGFQVHGGGKALVHIKDIELRALPPTVGAMTWQRRAMASQRDPLSPAAEQAGFAVPEGFEVELVVAETEEYGKFVGLAFDARGRLWTMTAMEYPVDANENPAASQKLFAEGGRDKVLVFEQPFSNPPAEPRVFADRLVMPLGILPYGDGAYVQYGAEIRFYRDRDGDGQADEHRAVLTGFGTQDSHLFPHQFTRAPGGQILLAQGLFNSSRVERPKHEAFADGTREIVFDHCKLASFSPDGSRFELLTAGPNNIWGLTISREGETWIQEANDLGYPIIPFEPGGRYTSGSPERLRSYQPLMPPTLAPAQMGGTGLSGLALADDLDGWPAPWGARDAPAGAPQVFYLANPITSSLQIIAAKFDGKRYQYAKQPDFLTSIDGRFRPVAIEFGPDGCLYVVDWYNKIISHNEVPRNFPERDKTRGRIWRIRHASQTRQPPVVPAKLANPELLAQLGAANAQIAELAWQEIVDRRATELEPALRQLSEDSKAPAARRLGALWALEGLAAVPASLLSHLAADENANLRHEAIRIAARDCSEAEFRAIAEPLVDDPAPCVRAALGDALGHIKASDPRTALLMIHLGRAPLAGDVWDVYDRDFERFLARRAMELHRPLIAQVLSVEHHPAIPLENRVLATLSLKGADAALGLAALAGQLGRPLTEEEIRVLAAQLADPRVAAALRRAAERPESRLGTLRALVNLRTSTPSQELPKMVSQAAVALWNGDDSTEARQTALEVAGAFGVRELEPQILKFASSAQTGRDLKLAALKALRELGASDVDGLAQLVRSTDDDAAVRSAALAALAESRDPRAGQALLAMWDDLDYRVRGALLERLAAHREGAELLLAALDAGTVDRDDVAVSVLEKMRLLLPGNPAMDRLWSEMADRLARVLRLSGHPEDAGDAAQLCGPFTVETWAQLLGEISNEDTLLSGAGSLDVNFYESHVRVWLGASRSDLAIARFKTTPDTWTHYAITRDAGGIFRIYVNGELDATSTASSTQDFPDLRIGKGRLASGGTNARLAEFRIWNTARTAEQIRDNFDRGLAGEPRPAGLVRVFSGADWGTLAGQARVEPTLDAPALSTPEQAQERENKFSYFRQLLKKPGDTQNGKLIFAARCLTCHQQGGQGGKIGPPLDGVGLTGAEALLRNILTPSAAMEGGYQNFRVVTRDGRIVQGLLVARDAQAVVLRQPNTADLSISNGDVSRAEFTARSTMPDGLLESLAPQEASDLFSYLLSLTATPAGQSK